MKVRHSEGVAIHTDPESCAGYCREAARALTIRKLLIRSVFQGWENVLTRRPKTLRLQNRQAASQAGSMSQMGQTEKNSVRAYVFRFALKLGHCSTHSACLKDANIGSEDVLHPRECRV